MTSVVNIRSSLDKKRFICFLVLFIVLFVSCGVGVIMRFGSSATNIPGSIVDIGELRIALPPELGQMENLPLGPTEQSSQSAEATLGFSDYQFVRVRDSRGQVLFDLYLAFWSPRRAHFLEVSTHAPDNCWVTNGMRLEAKEEPRAFFSDSRTTKLGNSREFSRGGVDVRVVYWHLHSGKSLSYAHYGHGKTLAFVWDNRSVLWGLGQAQYFVRLSTTLSWSEVEKSTAFGAVLSQLVAHVPLLDPEN